MDLEELSQELGVGKHRIVEKWRKKEPVDGYTIVMSEEDGERVWGVEGGFGDEEGDEEESQQAEQTEPEEEEPDSPLVTDSPVHGRTANNLAAAGLETAADIADAISVTSKLERARLMLTKYEGVGKTGAEQAIEWLEDLGLWERERIDPDLELECPHCGHVEFEAPIPVESQGVHPCDDCGEWYELQIDSDGHRMLEADPPEGHPIDGGSSEENDEGEIRCPHCDGLFDIAPPGIHESGTAECIEPDEEFEFDHDYGDCGEVFWVKATEDGYETYKEEPSEEADEDEPPYEAPEMTEEGEASELEDVDEETEEEPEEQPEEDSADQEEPEEDSAEEDSAEEEDEEEEDEEEEGDSRASDVVDFPGIAVPEPTTLPPSQRVHPALNCRSLGAPEHHTDEWYALRERGIGSSDAGAICGLSEHATIQDVWASKVPSEEVEEQPWLEEFAKFGKWFESRIRLAVEREFDIDIIPGDELGTLQSPRWDKALANIDGLGMHSDGWGIEEIKTTSEEWDFVPPIYHAQVQHQMAVTDLEHSWVRQYVCHGNREALPDLLERMRMIAEFEEEADAQIADWLLDWGTIEHWKVERDDEYIERLLRREIWFWDYVVEEMEPPEVDPEGTVDLSDQSAVVNAVEELASARWEKEQIKPILKTEDAAKDKARDAIEKAVAPLEETPKRVQIGDHHATLMKSYGTFYWRVYTDEGVYDIAI